MKCYMSLNGQIGFDLSPNKSNKDDYNEQLLNKRCRSLNRN
jgi:hypothetical protein